MSPVGSDALDLLKHEWMTCRVERNLGPSRGAGERQLGLKANCLRVSRDLVCK